MTLSGRPLQDDVMDAALFVGRDDELTAIMAALRQELNVALLSALGLGTTSTLRMLMHRLRTEDRRAGGAGAQADEWSVHYLRAHGATAADGLIEIIASELLGPAFDRDAPIADTLVALRRHRQELTTTHRARGGAATPAGRLHAVVILDDVRADAGHELFGRYRDELWTSGYRWVVAVPRDHATLLAPPAGAFFERVVQLGPLDETDAIELIERRQLWPPGWARRVARAVGGSPRELLAAARDHVDAPDGLEAAVSATTRRDAAVAGLGRPAAMLAGQLAALGAASASDEALLTGLGWTRARATQVLAELAEAGLVRSEDVKQPHGRPKKVFRLVTPAQFGA